MKQTLIRLTLLSLFLFSGTTHATVIKIATLSPDGTALMKKMRQAILEDCFSEFEKDFFLK